MINETYFQHFPTLKSERLEFRAIELSDAESILSIRSDREVMRYMDQKAQATLADAEAFIKRGQTRYKAKKGLFWAIINQADGQFMGDFAFWDIDLDNHRGEIGYTLKPEYWGKGYMTEVMRCLIGFGFDKLKLHSIKADINPGNDASKAVLLKFGFIKEAYFRQDRYFNGTYIDSEIYGLLAKDFKK